MTTLNHRKAVLTFESGYKNKLHIPHPLCSFLDLTKAAFISELHFWSKHNIAEEIDPHGWVIRTQNQWAHRLGISTKQVGRIAVAMENKGYIETELKKLRGKTQTRYRPTEAFYESYGDFIANRWDKMSDQCEDTRSDKMSDSGSDTTSDHRSDKMSDSGSDTTSDSSYIEDLLEDSSSRGSFKEIPPTPQGGVVSQGDDLAEVGGEAQSIGIPDSKTQNQNTGSSVRSIVEDQTSAPPKSKRKRKSQAKPDYDAWVRTYMAHKPGNWKGLRVVEGNSAREKCVARAIKSAGSEAEALERLVLALEWVKRYGNPFWRGEADGDLRFDSLFREKTMHVTNFWENALDKGIIVSLASQPPGSGHLQAVPDQPRMTGPEIGAEIRKEHIRLGVPLPEQGTIMWQYKASQGRYVAGVSTIYDLERRPQDAQDYLGWLQAQPNPSDEWDEDAQDYWGPGWQAG